MTKGERIIQLRVEKGISQTDLAIAIDVSKQTMYKYEMDLITNIPSDKIEMIAKALNTSPSYIMGWTNERSDDTDEQCIISSYRKLDVEDRKKASEYINLLLSQGKYKEDASAASA